LAAANVGRVRGLDELDLVEWARLEHAYGGAGDVPDMLRSLDEDAVGELVAALCHQGTRFSASAAAVPYLAGIAAGPDAGAETVAWALMLLGFVAIGDDDAYAFPRPAEAGGASYPEAVAAYRAVEAEVPHLLPLLAHPDPWTASAAVWLVSWFPALAERTLPAVRACRPTTATTLARGLLGDRPTVDRAPGERAVAGGSSGAGPTAGGAPGEWTAGPDAGWAEAVAALCASADGAPGWAVDAVLGHARRLRGADLVDPDLPYLGGDVAGILAATLRLVPAGRGAEAVSAVRVLADRARPPFQSRLRSMRDDLVSTLAARGPG
jgi:hypothetical protein